jgi:hypothetical protein
VAGIGRLGYLGGQEDTGRRSRTMLTVLADTFMIATWIEPRGPWTDGKRRNRRVGFFERVRRWGSKSAC